ncbi:Gly-x carboxypeptidase [Mycena venus]|uniref:Gly-x carboxypeptidase n=1 Tax=Mycena venus TaxID=2733690 RepID=A0A8H7CH65_9AGAR|nr:Gly-x carboxypeptidase [Mycena venus]
MQSDLSAARFSEKPPSSSALASRQRTRRSAFVGVSLIVFLAFLSTKLQGLRKTRFGGYPQQFLSSASTAVCPQVDALFPNRNADLWETTLQQTASSHFKARSIDLLAGAVQIPTESYDAMQPVGVDPRWDVFGEFHAYLARVFPLVHANLKLQKINTYGLWYEWTGLNSTLKPVLFTAHQDVVPVGPFTGGEWTHPPYSGYFDGHRVWGRGSADDKNGLIGILTAIETLLENGFTPTRTIVAAFGFDEEASGLEGAGELAKVLLGAYGQDGLAFIVDEGDGISKTFGTVVAYPCVAEKGYLDVVVEVTSPGGHSSVPPDHTASPGFALAFTVLTLVFADHRYSRRSPRPVRGQSVPRAARTLSRASVPFQTFQCLAQYGSTLPPAIKALIADSVNSDMALHTLEGILSKDKLYRSQIGTTQAVDVVSGGVKSNALPEEAHAVVNHRILAESSVSAVREHNVALLQPLAEKFNLSFNAFGVGVSQPGVPSSGNLTLRDLSDALEPAPVTPTNGEISAPYQVLSGSIKAAYNTRRAANNDNSTLIVAPSIMSGNTDTQFYWKLSPHIFRYGHGNSAGLGPEDILDGIHTVNESIDADDFVEIIRFYITLMLNADESSVL